MLDKLTVMLALIFDGAHHGSVYPINLNEWYYLNNVYCIRTVWCISTPSNCLLPHLTFFYFCGFHCHYCYHSRYYRYPHYFYHSRYYRYHTIKYPFYYLLSSDVVDSFSYP